MNAFLTPQQSTWLNALIAEQVMLAALKAKELTAEGHDAAAVQARADMDFAADVLCVVTELAA